MSGSRVVYGQKLSERERHVIALVAHGLTNDRIGAKLGLTRETIKTYTSWINRKLGARNRAHAVTIAAVKGYINLQAKEYVMASPCESSGCFEVIDAADGTVGIHGIDSVWIASGWAIDTLDNWVKFRDEVKAGKWDHIGTVAAVTQ